MDGREKIDLLARISAFLQQPSGAPVPIEEQLLVAIVIMHANQLLPAQLPEYERELLQLARKKQAPLLEEIREQIRKEFI